MKITNFFSLTQAGQVFEVRTIFSLEVISQGGNILQFLSGFVINTQQASRYKSQKNPALAERKHFNLIDIAGLDSSDFFWLTQRNKQVAIAIKDINEIGLLTCLHQQGAIDFALITDRQITIGFEKLYQSDERSIPLKKLKTTAAGVKNINQIFIEANFYGKRKFSWPLALPPERRDYKALLEGLLTGFLTEEDPVKAMLEWLLGELMKIESEAKVGAGRGKHSGERKTYFSGYRVRRLDSRVGTLYLVVPKVRKGGYVPFFVTERKRSEAALISLVQEAFINGVSTRKIERLAKSLGIEGISASEVSEITKGLDGRVEEFRTRQLKAEYPFIWVDAIYEKVRAGGKVVSMAMMIAYGVDKDGQREILAVEPMWEGTGGLVAGVYEEA